MPTLAPPLPARPRPVDRAQDRGMWRGRPLPVVSPVAWQRFTYMQFAGDVLTGIQTALEPDSATALRMARIYAKDGAHWEVWAGTPRRGVLVQVLG